MVETTVKLTPAEHLVCRIQELDAEVDRIRAEVGDPAEALGQFLRDWIGADALNETYQEYLQHRSSFLYDDYDDDDSASEDVGDAD